MLAAIQLVNYYVSDLSFRYDPASDDIDNKKVSFSHDVEFADDYTNVSVTLQCLIQDDAGLELDVTLNGFFSVEIDAEDAVKRGYNVQELCQRNTLSILFPYLRSVISDISLKGSGNAIILPTINIVQLIDSQNPKAKEDSFEDL